VTTAAQVQAASASLDQVAGALEEAAERFGGATRDAARHLGGLEQATDSPDGRRLSRRGTRTLDRAAPVPAAFGAGAEALRGAANGGRQLADQLGTLERSLDTLRGEQARLRWSSSGFADLTGEAARVAELDREVHRVRSGIERTVTAWERLCRETDAVLQGAVRQLTSAAQGLDLDRLGRGALTLGSFLIGVTRGTVRGHQIVDSTGTVASAGAGAIRHLQLRTATQRLQHLEQWQRRTTPGYLLTHPHLNRAERRQLLRQDRAMLRTAVPRARTAVTAATGNLRTPLTRVGAAARQAANTPAARAVGKKLGPLGVVLSGADSYRAIGEGRHLDATMNAVGAAAGIAVFFPPTAAVAAGVAVGVTVYQNREAIAKGASWVGGKVSGGVKRLFGR
jgi:hypothetical protein